MGYGERNTWATLIASVLGCFAYAAIIGSRLRSMPVAEVEWIAPMLWTAGAAIVASIIGSIGLGLVAGVRDPEVGHVADVRDRDISRFGDRVGQTFLVLGMVGALALCAVPADMFWIANTLYAGLALGTIAGSIARVVAYRGGMR